MVLYVCCARGASRLLWMMRFVIAILRRFRSFLWKRDSLCDSPCGYMPLIRVHTLEWTNQTINYIFWTTTINVVLDWLIHTPSLRLFSQQISPLTQIDFGTKILFISLTAILFLSILLIQFKYNPLMYRYNLTAW